jgi:S-formylglutathione hydrolase
MQPHFSVCVLIVVLGVAAGTLDTLDAARQAPPAAGTLERITVHGRALEGNLEGDSPDRPVVVYLPPSYRTSPQRRYPVVYYLHGYTATAEAYVK